MADQAKVTSFEALEAFRTNLILFLAKANNRVDEVGDEIRRTRGWLQNDQRLHWEGEIRRRRQVLGQAEQELLSAKLSAFRENLAVEMMAVRRAKQALAEAEKKLQNVKQWTRNYETCVQPLAKKLESLRGVLDHEMPMAISHLLQTQKNLEAYAESGTPRSVQNPPSAGQEENAQDPATTSPP